MKLSKSVIDEINSHPFMKLGGSDFMKLWDCKEVHIIYERVIKNVAIKERVSWKKIYDFRTESKYYSKLCVCVLIIYDALKYLEFGEQIKNLVMQEKELEIVNSYYQSINQ